MVFPLEGRRDNLLAAPALEKTGARLPPVERVPYISTSGKNARCDRKSPEYSWRPGVMIEAEDHRAAEVAGDQDEYRHGKQHYSEQHPPFVTVWVPTRFSQYQDQP